MRSNAQLSLRESCLDIAAGRLRAFGQRLPWPGPALLVWVLAWIAFGLLQGAGATALIAFVGASLGAALLALCAATAWRRLFIGAGFPLSVLGSGVFGTSLPAASWLLPLALLLLAYPRRAWRDAPLFPTPLGALRGLAEAVPLASGAAVLDAGCGLGAGLRELQREYPAARLSGLEWSWPLRIGCGWRCGFARIRRADIWQAPWGGYDLIYLFQRPESLARAVEKASREMKPGAWLASLEFQAPLIQPTVVLRGSGARPVWLYRLPFDQQVAHRGAAEVAPGGADRTGSAHRRGMR